MSFKKWLVGSLLVLPSVAAIAADITGRVTQENGDGIAGAKVAIRSLHQSVQTDANGQFTLANVDGSDVELHISANGFVHNNATVDLTNSTTVKVVLVPTSIEVIDVTASVLHASVIESAIPVNVMAGEELKRNETTTLGDTLVKLPGIHSSSHGGVAGSPIIRGLTGPRVMIVENGFDVGDASRVGADHAVGTETVNAQQIEVLRGPATLFYGSGAVGGVVNVVNNKIPTDSEESVEWVLDHQTVNERNRGAFAIKGGDDSIAYNVEGFSWKHGDYTLPKDMHHEDEHGADDDHGAEDDHGDEHHESDKLENSRSESHGFSLGVTKFIEDGLVGVSYSEIDREYGIPGHSHGDEHGSDDAHGSEDDDHAGDDDDHVGDDDDHAGDDDDHGHHGDEALVYSVVKQRRAQFILEKDLDGDIFNHVDFGATFSDYNLQEIEGDIIPLVFDNSVTELRTTLNHTQIGGWKGALNLHYVNAEKQAGGIESLVPSSKAESLAVSLVEEKHYGDVLVQLGVRVQNDSFKVSEIELDRFTFHEKGHGSDDHHAGDDDDHHVGDDDDDHAGDDDDHHAGDDDDHHAGDDDHHAGEGEHHVADAQTIDFQPITLSAGAVWDFAPGYNLALSASHAQRSPSVSELFANGPHLGTGTFDLGAAYEIEESGELHLKANALEKETSNNLDISFRKFNGDVGVVANVFYNRVDNYYYQSPSAYTYEKNDSHAGDEHDHHDHGNGLPIYQYNIDDVTLYGAELQVVWQVSPAFNAKFSGDVVRGELRDGTPLAMMPPSRLGSYLSYHGNKLDVNLDIVHHYAQTRIATYETETAEYTMVDFATSYPISVGNHSMKVYLRGENLLDEEARVHTSFIKDVAPLPGRNFVFGIRGEF